MDQMGYETVVTHEIKDDGLPAFILDGAYKVKYLPFVAASSACLSKSSCGLSPLKLVLLELTVVGKTATALSSPGRKSCCDL